MYILFYVSVHSRDMQTNKTSKANFFNIDVCKEKSQRLQWVE